MSPGSAPGGKPSGAPTAIAALVSAVVERMPLILAEVRETLRPEHPEYARFLADEGDEVVEAARAFTARLLAPPGAGAAPWATEAGEAESLLFEQLGRMHYQQGREVTGLLAAYRSGAAVAWSHIASEAPRCGLPSESFAALATALFGAVDRLSSASLRGFAREEAARVHARERARADLAELLLSGRADPTSVRSAATRAGWPLPAEAAVVVDPGEALARLGEGWLRPDASMAIVRGPGGPAWRARLASVLAGTGAVVGRCVPLAQLPATVGVAQRAARLLRAGVLAGDPLFVAEHLDALIVHGDQALFAALRERQLAPLRGLSGPCRDRLLATLDCWLARMGNQKATAEELGVHHQTVRYRLTQLRELFGPALDDPASRAALTLAVHWRPLTAPSTERHAARIPGGAPGTRSA